MQNDTAKPKGRSRLVRVLKAILIPFALLASGYIILVIFGNEETIGSLDDTLSKTWLPLTVTRWIVYAILSFVLAPFIIARLENKNQAIKASLELEADSTEDTHYKEQLKYGIKRCDAQRIVYERLVSKRHYIFITLIVFDVLTLQIPYLIK